MGALAFADFLSFFSSGALITFQRAPQFAVGISESMFGFVLVVEVVRGGRGGGRRLKPGGGGTTKPESLNIIVECVSR